MKGRSKPVYPLKWQNILTAPLNEGAIEVYLEALNTSLIERYVPSPIFVQSLLYFSLHPPDLPDRCPEPIALLRKILSQHNPSDLAARDALPTHPIAGRAEDPPRWSTWEAVNRAPLKTIKTTMRRCRDQGIWALVWERGDAVPKNARAARRRRRADGDDQEDEEEEEEEEVRKVSERGWQVIEWLVALWEKDQALHPDLGHSPEFLAQLPKRRDMQYDDPSLPLAVVESAIQDPSPCDAVNRQRLQIASKLVHLLVNTASSPSPPPFHPATLTLSLLPLFRKPLTELNSVLIILRDLPSAAYCHFLVHAIEDLAGIRAARSVARKQALAPSRSDFEGEGPFPPPTVRYTLDVLLTPGKQGTKDEMAVLQLALVAHMTQLRPGPSAWAATGDEAWRKRVENCMAGSERVEALRTMTFKVFDQL